MPATYGDDEDDLPPIEQFNVSATVEFLMLNGSIKAEYRSLEAAFKAYAWLWEKASKHKMTWQSQERPATGEGE